MHFLTDLKTKTVELDGNTVTIQELSSADLLDLRTAEKQNLELLVRSVLDDTGKQLFASADEAGKIAPRYLMPLIEAINELNGFEKKD